MRFTRGGKRAALAMLALATALAAAVAPSTPVGLGLVVGLATLTVAWLVALVAGGDLPIRVATYALVAFTLGLAASLAV